MNSNFKQEFIQSFLPETVDDICSAQIDLDISDLSIADVLRNINKTFPLNSRNRNSIANGELAVTVLCKSDTLYPISGIFLVIVGKGIKIEVMSKNYIVIGVSEENIKTDEGIKSIIDNITKYLIANFKDFLQKFNDFYVKFVFDDYESIEEYDD